MPWCRRNFAPAIYVMFFYGVYMLLVFPLLEMFGWALKTFGGFDIGEQSGYPRYLYIATVCLCIPCYLIMFFMYWKKHRATALFVPRWRTDEPLTEDDLMCTICYELFVNPHTLRCQHSFCKKCIQQCLPITRRCPSCQQWVYRSSKNRLLKSKVLNWVKENGREEEYEEIVKLQASIRPVKTSCCTKLYPFILPFFEIPRDYRRQEIPLQPIVRAEPMESNLPEPVIVHMVDEVDNLPAPTPLVIKTTLSVIMEVSEEGYQESPHHHQLSAATSIASIHADTQSIHSV